MGAGQPFLDIFMARILCVDDELHAARTPSVTRTKTKEARMRLIESVVTNLHAFMESHAVNVVD